MLISFFNDKTTLGFRLSLYKFDILAVTDNLELYNKLEKKVVFVEIESKQILVTKEQIWKWSYSNTFFKLFLI